MSRGIKAKAKVKDGKIAGEITDYGQQVGEARRHITRDEGYLRNLGGAWQLENNRLKRKIRAFCGAQQTRELVYFLVTCPGLLWRSQVVFGLCL